MAKISREKFKVHEGVFDEFTLKTLEMMKRKHYFDELGRAIKTGKEGDVYFGYRGEKTLAIKIYRMTSANFKKISQYIIRDYRFRNIKGSLRKVILVWAEKEFRNMTILGLAYESGFNSKSVFHTYFKKSEGITPNAYLKSIN